MTPMRWSFAGCACAKGVTKQANATQMDCSLIVAPLRTTLRRGKGGSNNYGRCPELLPGVAQGDGAVEAAVAVANEVAVALELEALLGLGVGERRLELGADDLHRRRVQIQQEIVLGAGFGHLEQA